MRIVIVGPGALGSLLTARIALFIEKERAAGADNELPKLYLLDYKPERARRLRESGLLLEEKGQRIHCRIQVEVSPETCAGCDVLFLCVKSTGLVSALERISPFLLPETLLVAMQNGIGHLDVISALGCMSGVGITSEGATLISPGHVRHGGSGTTRLGVLDAETDSNARRLAQAAELLNASGLETRTTRNPLRHIWAKLFVNVAINALTAIHRCPNGELLALPAARDVMDQAVREAVSVAGALDIAVEGDPVASAFRVCESTAANISSMLQDVQNRRRTEIDAINGAVVSYGNRLGIPTPVNADLVRQVKRIEASYRH
jgi:2-dehydropantoate 2-reductase